jgi:hypothetical protein
MPHKSPRPEGYQSLSQMCARLCALSSVYIGACWGGKKVGKWSQPASSHHGVRESHHRALTRPHPNVEPHDVGMGHPRLASRVMTRPQLPMHIFWCRIFIKKNALSLRF